MLFLQLHLILCDNCWFFVNNKVLYFFLHFTDYGSSPLPPLPPPLNIPKRTTKDNKQTSKKKTGTKHKKRLLNYETNTIMYIWMEPQKLAKHEGMTPQLSHHPYMLTILPTIHTTKLSTCTLHYSHLLNECITTHQQGTQYCSLNSVLHMHA